MTLRSAVVIAGTHSGVGKTTVATALMAALRRRGMAVQGFKVGPDFIDPTFHRAATNRPGLNLDGWMLSRETNLTNFVRATQDVEVAVVEGVMGLFDGQSATSMVGSSAEMARWLRVPVLLVVDASGMAGSVAAIVKGFEDFDPDVHVAGVIFNRVAGAGHFAYLREALAQRCRAKALGYLPRDPAIEMPERHLGLKLAEEVLSCDRLQSMADWIEHHLDLDEILGLGACEPQVSRRKAFSAVEVKRPIRPRIGVAHDRAFCFYYQDNLDLLAQFGAELIEFSPVDDAHLPPGLAGLYIGGGYPELHAGALSANESMRAGVSALARSGAPIYAECGGLMYLCEGIADLNGGLHPMAGLFPTWARMKPKLVSLGYAEIEIAPSSQWPLAGARVRGHQFRYSEIDAMPEQIQRLYRIIVSGGKQPEGYLLGATLASYIHLHFHSCPKFAAGFVAACADHLSL